MNIKKLRQGLNLTKKEFAKRMGVSLTTLDKWEYGIATPNPDNMDKLERMARE